MGVTAPVERFGENKALQKPRSALQERSGSGRALRGENAPGGRGVRRDRTNRSRK